MHFDRKKVDATAERNIITGMIVSDRYLKEVQSFLNYDLLKIPYVKTVATWCTAYFEKYNKAPKNIIQEIYDSYARNGLDETDARLISEFLADISDEHDTTTFDETFMLDEAEYYFRHNALQSLQADITTFLTHNRIEEAEALISNFKRVARPSSKGVNVFSDRTAIKKAFDTDYEYLFKLPGAWGDLIGHFVRGDFFAIFGPPGRYKSFALIEIALKASLAGYKTLFLSLEMTEGQIMRRIYQNLLEDSVHRVPLFNKTYRVPILDCIYNQLAECNKGERQGLNMKSVEGHLPPDHIPCTMCKSHYDFRPVVYYLDKVSKGISYSAAARKGKEIYKELGEDNLKLLCYPGGSIDMREFSAVVDNMEYYDNFRPMVILTDYADRFKPPRNINEVRHQLDSIWKDHESMAKERNCVMGTVSHTVNETYERDIKQGDAAENKAKMRHLTVAMSLNQTMPEKKAGKIRTSVLKLRDDEFNTDDEVVILQQLGLGKFYLDSYRLPPEMKEKGSEEPEKKTKRKRK